MTNVERWSATERIRRKQRSTLDKETVKAVNSYANKALETMSLLGESETQARDLINKGDFYGALNKLTALRTTAELAEKLIRECHNKIQNDGEE